MFTMQKYETYRTSFSPQRQKWHNASIDAEAYFQKNIDKHKLKLNSTRQLGN